MSKEIINMTCLDGWNFYSYNGLPEDEGTEYVTVAYKNMGRDYIVKKDFKRNTFFCEINTGANTRVIQSCRLSKVLSSIDEIIDKE